MALSRRGRYFWIDLRHRGRRIRISTRTGTKAVAKRQHDELAARLWKEREAGLQLSDALLRWVKARPRRRNDLNAVRQIRAVYPDRALIDVDAASFADAFADKTPATYNRIATIMRAALRLAERAGWIERAPPIDRKREAPHDPYFLSREEWDKLRAELPAHLQPMASFAAETGLRWGNVAALEWRRVSIERKLVWIPASQAKGGKPLSVPLSTAALAVLQGVSGARTGYVFTYLGKPLGSAKTAFGKAVIRAGLDGFRWHDLRHTWASWHAQNGTPLLVLKELGGWADMKMVLRYAHLSPEHLAAFADNAMRGTKRPHTKQRKPRRA